MTRRRTLALELPARWVEGQAPKQAPLPLPCQRLPQWSTAHGLIHSHHGCPQNLPKVNQLGASWGRLSARIEIGLPTSWKNQHSETAVSKGAFHLSHVALSKNEAVHLGWFWWVLLSFNFWGLFGWDLVEPVLFCVVLPRFISKTCSESTNLSAHVLQRR